jgi:hypothetical protein
MELRKLAEKIAREIMTMEYAHGSVVVERIAMMKKQSDGSERTLGGRCMSSVADVIEKHLADEPDRPVEDALRERVREENTLSVMPLIGPLLDAWDDLPNDVKGASEISRLAVLINRIALRIDPNGDDKV